MTVFKRARAAAATACEAGGAGVTSSALILAGQCDHSSEVQAAATALLDLHDTIMIRIEELTTALGDDATPIGEGTPQQHRERIEAYAEHRALTDVLSAIYGRGRLVEPRESTS